MGELIQQVKQIWDKMDLKKRLLFGSGILGLLIFFIFIFQISKPSYELLYGNLSQVEQDEIIGELVAMGLPYKKDYGTIYVPNASEVRAQLMKAGIPKGGIVGLEIFDRSSLGATSFQNTVNYKRALQGELRRTLREIEGIIDAQVLLDIPEQEPIFEDEKKPPTAAITLTLRRPNALSQAQISAIVNFVVGSVVGMKEENVTIIDNYANDLTAELRTRSSLHGGQSLEERLAVKFAFERELEQDIERMLTRVFGQERVVARVNAELNLDYQEIKKELYGDRGVPRSEQEVSEAYEGTGQGPYGIPGTDSNITEYRLLSDNQRSNYEKDERIVNYEIDRIEERIVKAPGEVRRLSVSLFIDNETSPELQMQLEDSVAAAVGLDFSRGDRISVVSLEFNKETVPVSVSRAISWPAVSGLGLLALLLVGGSIYLVLRRARQKREEAQGIDLVVGEAADETAATEELTPEEIKRRQRQEYLETLAREHPQDVAVLIRTWMLED